VTAVVLRGDARALPLPDGCVDLIVTSPPFWQLRSYSDNGEHYAGQIGSEETPAEYIAALLECTREWVRVLKPSGSLFVDLGDKFATRYSSTRGRGRAGLNGDDDTRGRSGQNHTGAGEKSLLGLPWRYALACMDDLGLILRRDIIWSKPNGLPESVTDRCRSSHEYLFHFTRQPRYYAAVDEIRESYSDRVIERQRYVGRAAPPRVYAPGDRNDSGRASGIMGFGTGEVNPLGKLPGSVWDIPSQPLTVPAALGVDHFAAFPMELPRRCVLGWSPPGVCTACGEGRRPVVDRPGLTGVDNNTERRVGGRYFASGMNGGQKDWERRMANPDRITGYACACPQPDAPTRPALVVDPFGGTGTTALVAAAYGRTGISVDMSGDYSRLARWRTTDPAERAKALMVAKPPPVPAGQGSLFDDAEAS
jgi:site-specific DNA-methyltransferase (adenine-specific)